ncbi:MAG: M55 family metallopeptidase, partial [Candidatus Cloacimonetes bacterium]|nr:M55 family metallopeptidase [Candidatus Cloacimonadota bacterium]
MIIYISLDMEGICGTYNWEQETKDRSSVIYAITKQMEYVVEGIRQSDKNHLISDIIIADSHSSGDNLPWSFSEKDSRISILSGSPRPYYMMPGFSEEIDRVFLIGYHAGTGAYQGNMDHTYSNRRVHRISVNDIPMNEAFLNTAYASCFKVPVVLVSGDACLKQEMLANDKMPWIEFIETKKAVSKFAALNYSAERVKIDTIEKVKNALK